MRLAIAVSGIHAIFMSLPAQAGFLPENDLWKEDRIFRADVMTEVTFNEVIDEAEAFYRPLVKETFQADLKVNRYWSNSTVNAQAIQQNGLWSVDMYGGLARRPETTRDGFALVLCHEIGHHLGGYPFHQSGFFGIPRDWAASEGQADYFATLSCSRQLWKGDLELNASYRALVPDLPRAKCDAAWFSSNEQNLCYRQMMAAKSVADLSAIGDFKKAEFALTNPNQVSKSESSHPNSQCRLDTYAAASLCIKAFHPLFIPGISLEPRNRNSKAAEEQARLYSCFQEDGVETGFRPRCWFKPLTEGAHT